VLATATASTDDATDAATTPPVATARPCRGDVATANHADVDISIESNLSIKVNVVDDSIGIATIAATAAPARTSGVESGMY
jgi:hypothetical protein